MEKSFLGKYVKCCGVFICVGRACVKAFLHAHVSFAVIGWCWLAAGSESGRSSPYYGQEGRSSTPTTYQPPKHFHVPGRTPHLPSSYYSKSHKLSPKGIYHHPYFMNANHPESSSYVTWGWGGVEMCLSCIFKLHVIALAFFPSYYIFTLFFFTFPYYYPSFLFPLPSHLPNRDSDPLICPLLLHVSPLHLLSLSSATGDPNIYRKPPIYKRTGTVQLASPFSLPVLLSV